MGLALAFGATGFKNLKKELSSRRVRPLVENGFPGRLASDQWQPARERMPIPSSIPSKEWQLWRQSSTSRTTAHREKRWTVDRVDSEYEDECNSSTTGEFATASTNVRWLIWLTLKAVLLLHRIVRECCIQVETTFELTIASN